ncbi:MAG TPA: YdjY domain-containing protein [Pirellulales bacterium]|nr:YdjY domain-containing protein [Pirellulales bacterium]
MKVPKFFVASCTTLALCLAIAHRSVAEDETASDDDAASSADGPKKMELVKLDAKAPLWVDKTNKRVVMIGKVCLREGQLEMFACPEGTKEHESVLSVPVLAERVHTALILLGADPGKPVQFTPEYRPASGPVIDVALYWTDESGKRCSAWAQDWVQDARTGKALSEPWVFGGSMFYVDEKTGKRDYLANHGELICVSNFSSAMLDLPVESSDKAGQLLFNAYTDHIPPANTKVTIVLRPRADKAH